MMAKRWLAGCWVAACALTGLGCSSEAEDGNLQRYGPALVAPAAAAEYRLVCARYGERLTLDERSQAQNEIFIAPLSDQLSSWRALGFCAADDALQSEALRQLAWLDDPVGARIAASALARDNHAVRAAAAQALAHYGSPAADGSKLALRVALEAADESDERQLVWALVVLGDERVFGRAIDLWGAGKLTTVRRIDGSPAFDPERVAALASVPEIVALADDPRSAMRGLAAALLAQRPSPSAEPKLRQLAMDDEISVAAPAVSGLAQLERSSARQAVVAQLRVAAGERRQRLLAALRDNAGGLGLVLALDSVVSEPESQQWFQYQQIFRMLAELADPRSADPLSLWLQQSGRRLPLHWQTEAALRLAELGDVRGVEVLGKRMTVESAELYHRDKPWQVGRGGHLSRGDSQRIAAARLLGDLAIMHPTQQARLSAAAGASVLHWSLSRVLPHAHGLRFLAAVDYEPAREPIHSWACPRPPLPGRGAAPPLPMQFEVVSSALCALGSMESSQALPLLLSQFDRKDDSLGAGQRKRSRRSRSILALALRNIGVGAAHGLAHMGQDAGQAAADRLIQVAEDGAWPDDVRVAACGSLAWVASDETIDQLAGDFARASSSDGERALCFAVTMARRADVKHTGALIRGLRGELPGPARLKLGSAIGRTGWASAGTAALHERKLLSLLTDPERRQAAALALILGGSSQAAVQAAAAMSRAGKRDQSALHEAYGHAIATVFVRDIALGNIHRWVANAEAIGRVTVRGKRQKWAADALTAQLRGLDLDTGPHALTRPMVRYQLLARARDGDEAAVRTLQFMGERGSTLALAAAGGPVGRLAQRAVR